jgi:hypothetical protein
MRKTTALLCAAMLLLVANVPAQAFTFCGNPIEGGSWSQGFNESGVGNFDRMQVDWLSGTMFEPPTFTSLASGWNVVYENGGRNAVALGTAIDNMTFNIHFTGNSADGVSFQFTAFNGTVVKESARATYNGGWNFAASGSPAKLPSEVPEPGTLLMLGIVLGLGGTIAMKRHRS